MTRVPRAQPQTTSYILTTSESVPCLSSGYYLCLCAGSSTSQTMNGVRVTGSDLHDQLRTLFRLRLGPGHAGGARTFTCGCCGKTLKRASDARTCSSRLQPSVWFEPSACPAPSSCSRNALGSRDAAEKQLLAHYTQHGVDWGATGVHTADATLIWSDQIDIELAL